MGLRKWVSGIKPIDSSPKEAIVWLTFKGVPPLITPKGGKLVASQVGTPINKFIRDGLDITVCVVRDVTEKVKDSLEVVLDGGEQCKIDIDCRELRVYKRKWGGGGGGECGKLLLRQGSPSHESWFLVSVLHAICLNYVQVEGTPGCSHGETAGGGMGNESKASLQVEDSLIQQTIVSLSHKSVRVEIDGVLVSDDEEVVYDETLVVSQVSAGVGVVSQPSAITKVSQSDPSKDADIHEGDTEASKKVVGARGP
ncbi:hypothetical protein LINPERPRIM_LOCUS37312 [Linum perenne]